VFVKVAKRKRIRLQAIAKLSFLSVDKNG